MPFPKGVSGNPAGRPRSGEALAEYIRQVHGEDARRLVDRLTTIALDDGDIRDRMRPILQTAGVKPKVLNDTLDELCKVAMTAHVDIKMALAAAGIILERGYGRPPQEIALTSGEGDVMNLSPEDLAARVAVLAERVRKSATPSASSLPS